MLARLRRQGPSYQAVDMSLDGDGDGGDGGQGVGEYAGGSATHVNGREEAEEEKEQEYTTFQSREMDYLKSVVYGGIDGITTTFATVTICAGAGLDSAVLIAFGVAQLFAHGLALGMGDMISAQAQLEYEKAQRKQQQWDLKHNLKFKLEDMIHAYVAKGVSIPDATSVMCTLAKYEDAFLELVLSEELGIPPEEADQSPVAAGGVTILSFIAFGCIPVLIYAITMPAVAQLWTSMILTLATLFGLGAIKGHMIDVGQRWWHTGLIVSANASVAAAVGFAVGFAMRRFLETHIHEA